MTKIKNNKLTIEAFSADEPEALSKARAILRPSIRGAVTSAEFSSIGLGEIELDALAKAMDEQITAVNKGNLQRAEAMLVAQAHSLDAIFHRLAWRANEQVYLKKYETYFRLALKAQSQCVRTLEVLASIKNPPIVYTKQANIANGPQQINNGTPAYTGETEKQKNELLEHNDGNRLDTRATSPTSGINLRAWKPWKQSTGPKTAEGKAKAKMNAYTGGTWRILKEMNKVLKEQRLLMNDISKDL